LEQKQKMLRQAGFEILEIADIYPPEYSKENTHYFAIVAGELS